MIRHDIVIPSVGRPTLHRLLDELVRQNGPSPGRIIVVDDRRDQSAPLTVPPSVTVLCGRAAGPAAARNLGWRASNARWVVFLDDDVVPTPAWWEDLARDLRTADDVGAGATQGRIVVPLPSSRAPTDWERNVAGLEEARWATADMAYRRAALLEVGGFDERFPRAYREDADLGLRVRAAGWAIVAGERTTEHPVPPADPWVSVRKQAGNADDPLMRRLHGPDWRERAGTSLGRRPWHLLTTALGVGAVATRQRWLASAWAALTAEFAWRRIAPGPRDAREVATMIATSAVIPPAATYHWLRGVVRARRLVPRAAELPSVGSATTETSDPAIEAVLVDRDGTIIVDVPYNGDPERVEPVAGAKDALDRLRAAGLPVAVITNQSGIGRGYISRERADAVNARIDELLGPFDGWFVCPHAPDDGCDCRKPAPGLVLKAAAELGVDPARTVLIGDIGSDVEAAANAGSTGILVPTDETRREEIEAATHVAPHLAAAVDRILSNVLVARHIGDADGRTPRSRLRGGAA